MTKICPYICDNKTEDGYCRNTACINPTYAQIVFWSNNRDTFPSPCRNCRNNPANGGNGICHCILGTQTIY